MNSCDISQRQCTQFSILSANKRQPSHQSETDASLDYCYRSSAPLLLRLPSICVTSIKTVSVLLLVALQKMYFARSPSLRSSMPNRHASQKLHHIVLMLLSVLGTRTTFLTAPEKRLPDVMSPLFFSETDI